ncbi:hypothetical protein GQ600_11656 [Phytophthora cactorum]|nr:hypothetical protein GQ600_11656 [Phytophthora cactorum]
MRKDYHKVYNQADASAVSEADGTSLLRPVAAPDPTQFHLAPEASQTPGTWQFRRQRRVWSAWVFFAQHSLDVKHSIYDRLVICALRDSLQGAWGHWKAHTRHQMT